MSSPVFTTGHFHFFPVIIMKTVFFSHLLPSLIFFIFSFFELFSASSRI
ncbi:hypothetical protein MY9_3260 [Bacillus sp. JS]|nr:hypothetical protein MY9_3260 [Bacillus sp. JS]